MKSKAITIQVVGGGTYSYTPKPDHKMSEEDILNMLSKISINTLHEMRNIYLEKNKCVKEMQFQKATELRDKEKKLYKENGLPTNLRVHEMEDLLETIRERQINTILNENR